MSTTYHNIHQRLYDERRSRFIRNLFSYYRDTYQQKLNQPFNEQRMIDLKYVNEQQNFLEHHKRIIIKIITKQIDKSTQTQQVKSIKDDRQNQQASEESMKIYDITQKMFKYCMQMTQKQKQCIEFDSPSEKLSQFKKILVQNIIPLICLNNENEQFNGLIFISIFVALFNINHRESNTTLNHQIQIFKMFEESNGWQMLKIMVFSNYSAQRTIIYMFIIQLISIMLKIQGQLNCTTQLNQIIDQIMVQSENSDYSQQDLNNQSLNQLIWFLIYSIPKSKLLHYLNFGLFNRLMQAQLISHCKLCLSRMYQICSNQYNQDYEYILKNMQKVWMEQMQSQVNLQQIKNHNDQYLQSEICFKK